MKKPKSEFELGDRTIKMTYGLQMDLQRMIPDASQVVSLLMTDPYLRDFVVRRTMTDSKTSIIDEEKLVPTEDIDLDADQVLSLLDWVSEHLLYFFGSSAAKAANLTETYQEIMARLMPSTAGSEGSPSTTPSVGAGGASKET